MSIDYNARLARLRAAGAEKGVQAVALVPGANLRYFTGRQHFLSERPVIALVTQDDLSFIVPGLDASKLAGDDRAFAWNDVDGYEPAFAEAADTLLLAGAALGVDDLTMRVFEWLAFEQAAAGVQVVGMAADLLYLRSIKTDDEVDAMARAVALSEAALTDTLAALKPGMTEQQIGEMLSTNLRAHGSQGDAFGPIVLIGDRSALPHGHPGDRPLAEGDFLLFDFGGVVDGYPADITRTFVFGAQPTAEQERLYRAVLRANEAARLVVKPGVTCGDIDKAARDEIEAAGLGAYFIHRTGHGLGLEVHEMPQVAAGVETPLEPGMVFTIEPGVYVPGVGGVRIEDNIVVTEDGSRSLTSFSRRLTNGDTKKIRIRRAMQEWGIVALTRPTL